MRIRFYDPVFYKNTSYRLTKKKKTKEIQTFSISFFHRWLRRTSFPQFRDIKIRNFFRIQIFLFCLFFVFIFILDRIYIISDIIQFCSTYMYILCVTIFGALQIEWRIKNVEQKDLSLGVYNDRRTFACMC